ncbi:hypothetical protein [Acinetobacter baumannii]|uniref:Uncharacterized protein n=1 Tax=Acinetobacter baumannii TaxID=470 RepID=A0AAJ0VMA9_ACIBA|nr:hypothetical protein [Acinetobacter baumannii]ATN89016.1 hypothetical protein SEA_DMPSTRDIVER_211 [Mycobacterium phage DmpstrDiver]KZA06970.1 hypothetical protein LV35_04227 [Acinetobacter baumannii]
MKTKLMDVRPYVALYRDDRTGIAWVENGSLGIAHSAHPNIDASGSVRGMKDLGYWERDARAVRCRGFIYNIDTYVVSDNELDQLAAKHCQCGGKHPN